MTITDNNFNGGLMQIINRLGHASKRTRVFCLLGSENIATHVYIYIFFEGELCRNGLICICG